MSTLSALKHDNEESGKLFKLFVESVSHYAIFMIDPSGHVLTWNIGAERLKGYTASEILGKHVSTFYGPADVDNHKPEKDLQEAAATGAHAEEGWRVRKDGTRFWADVTITAIRDATGQLLGFGQITRDLTERREAELRYRLLVEGVADYAIFSLDPTGVVTSWNAGAQRIKGYSADEIIGRHFSVFYTPEDRERELPAYVLRTAAERGHFEAEGWRIRKDGKRFWSNIVVTALYDEEGRLRGFSKVTRDMSDRKRLLDQIRQHAAELELEVKERERTNAELEAFSYSVSHDLRAPLRAIEGFSTALREDYGKDLQDGALEYLDEIEKASRRMSRLVQDLLSYSRLSRVEIALGPVKVKEAVERAMQEIGIGSKNVHLDVPDRLAAFAHESTLVQVLANLIGNGLKFHRPGVEPQVHISAEESEGAVIIDVSDKGIGIEAQYLARIFNVFERLHDMEEYPGTGIGLAIVKRGLERMGGKIEVKSTIGSGSTFTISLPATPVSKGLK